MSNFHCCRIGAVLAIFLAATSGSWAASSNPGTKPKSTIQDDLAFAVIAKTIDPNAIQSDFVMADELLVNLQTMKRFWAKKPVSNEEMIAASNAVDYIKGVYQGFMLGVAAENYRRDKNGDTLGAPICPGTSANLQSIVEAALKGLGKFPEEKLHGQMASNLIVPAFIKAKLYDKCLKPGLAN